MPKPLSSSDPTVYDELKLLKDKLASLEDSFKDATPMKTPNPPNPPNPSYPPRERLQSRSKLEYFGYNPVEYGDSISFFEGSSSILMHSNSRKSFGPLNWFMMIRSDTALLKFWEHMNSSKKMKKKQIFQVDNKLNEQTAQVFKRKLQQIFGESEELQPFVSKVGQDTLIKDRRLAKSSINERAMSLGLTFYEGGFEEELALIDKIDLVLPKKRVIWKLFDRFFTVLYPLFPLLDEDEFKAKLSNIIGKPDSSEEKVVLKVDKKLDFIYLGTLLVVLRFTYLTLFTNSSKENEANLTSNDPSPEVQNLKYLLNNAINIDCIDVAEMCLELFNLSRNCLFPLLQLGIFLKCYRIYSPEDSELSDYNNSGSSIYTGTLLQMACSMGLNREPDVAIGIRPDLAKQNNLGRKIWFFLMILDLNTAISSGTPVHTHPLSYDTKTPFYTPGNNNIRDLKTEKLVVDLFDKVERNLPKTTELMNLIVNVRGKTDLNELCSKLDVMELGFANVYGSLNQYVKLDLTTTEQVIRRGIEMKIYFLSVGFLISIFFRIFNHYEKKRNREFSFFYMKKLLYIAIHELLPYYGVMLENTSKIFKNSTDITITPVFLIVVHKSLILFEALYMRTRFTIDDLEASPNHTNNINLDVEYQERFKSLRILQGLCSTSIRILFDTVAKLSNRYYYAWRMLKAGNFIWKALQEGEVFDQFVSQRVTLDMSTEMINELNVLMTHSLDIYETLSVRNNNSNYTNNQESWDKDTPMNGNVETPGFDNRSKMSPFPFQDGIPSDLPRSFGGGTEMSFDGSFTPFNNVGNTETTQEIDDLWYQMMSLKQDPSAPHFSLFDNTQPVSEALSTNGSNSGAPSALDLDGSLGRTQTSPDFLAGAIPFDDLFKKA